ncbi:MAG: putative DNA binding domain-containing protein, partial [Candidatus Methanomethylicia archaeon]
MPLSQHFQIRRGGTILIGVNDDGSVVGVGIGRRTLEELSNNIAQSTDPKVFPEIKVDRVWDKYIIEIRVSEHRDKPVFAKGIAYKRVGKINVKMDRDEIINLLRASYEISYEDSEATDIGN